MTGRNLPPSASGGRGRQWYELLVPLPVLEPFTFIAKPTGRRAPSVCRARSVPPLPESDESGDAGAETPADVGGWGS